MSERKHAKYSPSKLPILAVCPCFEPAPVGEAAWRGTTQHKVIEDYFKGRDPHWNDLTADERLRVRWAIRWINNNTSANRQIEICLTAIGSDIALMERGYADVLDVHSDHVHVVDYKSGRQRDASHQLAAYALMAMRRYEKAHSKVTVLYGNNFAVVPATYTAEQAAALIIPVLNSVVDPNKKPNLCQYCDWCIWIGKCDAFSARIKRIFGKKD